MRSWSRLARRMIAIAALWISVLLIGGGFALDRVLTGAITRSNRDGLDPALDQLMGSGMAFPWSSLQRVSLANGQTPTTITPRVGGGAALTLVAVPVQLTVTP